ncbi:BamA/TamA family outer membrane protein, partial [bacterium]|nr:BamA/TamA family outer membrane protein [bacterium]
KNIVFEGNTVVDSEKLLSLMETKVGDVLNTKTLYGDTNSINQYYNDELGYLLKPTHIKDVNWTESGDLKIKITDGMIVNDIEIVGNTAYTTEKLRSFLTFKKGELFNQKVAKADTDKIAALYEKDDYILDTIRPTADSATGVVTIKIVEAIVEDIKVEGNTRTKDYVVFRHMNTKVGQILKRKRIQKDLERLNHIGYFSSVNIEPEAGSEMGKVVLAIKVKEQKTGQVTLGLGYTGGGSGAVRSGVTGGVSVSERNFKGTGWGGSAQFQAGVNSDIVRLSVFNPAINSNRDSISFSFYTQNYNELTQVVPNSDPIAYSYYDDKRTGFIVSYGHPLSEFFTVYLALKTEKIKLTRSGISEYEPIGLFDGRANSGTLSAVYDNRDDLFNPKSGTFINASVQSAGGFLGGDEEFTKTQLEIRKYIPIGKKMTLALRAWGGAVNGDSFSSSDVFYLGGTDSLRGYHDNIFMGDRMILLNAELRFPIAKLTVLSGAIFVDAGNAWFASQGSSKLHTDAGVGLRLTLPTLGLGVIRLDYAMGEDGSRLTIGFGQSF